MFANITRTEIFMILLPVMMLLYVLELVRRRKLREDYSLLWLGTFGLILALALSRGILDHIATLMGIFYPPTALFVIGFALLLMILLQFSTVITRLAVQNKQAAQHIALLNHRIAQLEGHFETSHKNVN